jgi:hypothetical protein
MRCLDRELVRRSPAVASSSDVPEWVDFDGVEYAFIDGDVQVADSVRVFSTPRHSFGTNLSSSTPPTASCSRDKRYEAEDELLQAARTVSADDPPPDPEQYRASAARPMQLKPRRVRSSHSRAGGALEPGPRAC